MTTKEAIAAGKTRMEKAVEDFRKELGTLRTGARECFDPGRHPRGLSRDAHAGESTRHGDGAGGDAAGSFVGSARGPRSGCFVNQRHHARAVRRRNTSSVASGTVTVPS